MKTVFSLILLFLLSLQSTYCQDSLSISNMFRPDSLYDNFRSTGIWSVMMDSIALVERQMHADNLEHLKERTISQESDLANVFNLIERKGIPGAVADSSSLSRFLYKENGKIYLNIDHDIFRYPSIVQSYPNAYDLINKGLIVITTKGFHSNIVGSVGDIDLPPITFTSTQQVDYKQLAAVYLKHINDLMASYGCNPKFLKYYLAQESSNDSWKERAIKRKFFIEFIKKGCK